MYFVHINAEQIGGNMKIKELLEQVRDVELTEEQEKHIKEYLGIKNKKWRPEYNDLYYYIDSFGHIALCNYEAVGTDINRLVTGNCFKTKKEAEFRLEQIKVYNELKNFADENNEEIEWKNGTAKYIITFDTEDEKIGTNIIFYIQDIAQIYFSSKDLAEQAIEKVGADRIKKYLFGVE